jgi:hypothetical protein
MYVISIINNIVKGASIYKKVCTCMCNGKVRKKYYILFSVLESKKKIKVREESQITHFFEKYT